MDGLVLAGGRSRRFGQDKALAHFDSQALSNVAHATLLLKALCSQVYVSCNPSNIAAVQAAVAALGATVIPDRDPVRDKGPISGLWAYFATLPRAHADVLVVACDYLGLTLNTLAPLVGRFGYLCTGEVAHYTCCRLDIAFTTLENQVLAQDWRWRHLLELAGCPPLTVPTAFTNINYPEELPHADSSPDDDR